MTLQAAAAAGAWRNTRIIPRLPARTPANDSMGHLRQNMLVVPGNRAVTLPSGRLLEGQSLYVTGVWQNHYLRACKLLSGPPHPPYRLSVHGWTDK